MEFLTDCISKNGGRAENQDFCGYEENNNISLWAVADGMGGHLGGEIASSIAIEHSIKMLEMVTEITESSMLQLFDEINKKVRQGQKEYYNCDDMQTTFVLLMTDGLQTYFGNIGDSRCYCFSQGKINQQTKDHSIPQILVNQGEIGEADIRNHEDRNKVTKSLGKDDSIKPAIYSLNGPIKSGDSFLLCTDGFWEYVLEQEMEVDYIKSSSPHDWLKKMEGRLLERVPIHHDNYTAIAVFVK